jgi:cytochrome c oxidase assembly protein subunit 15
VSRVNPASFRRIAAVAWAFQALIVVSGAAVRLTEAGLGCEDWPSCSEDRLVPEFELHGWIEFGNRLISLVVTLSTVAVLVGAYRRRPRRADLIVLAWLLVAGTVGQIALGGITVLLELHPVAVSGHFLLSMALLFVAHRLWRRADPVGIPAPRRSGDPTAHRLLQAVLPLASIVVLTGTLVTGSGPHSGDSRADRLGFELAAITRVHSVTVWVLMACVVGLAVLVRPGTAGRHDLDPRRDPWPIARLMILAVTVQGAIGYTQFALGVPAGLVELHVAGAVTVWMLAVALHLRAFDGAAADPVDLPDPDRLGVEAGVSG